MIYRKENVMIAWSPLSAEAPDVRKRETSDLIQQCNLVGKKVVKQN